MARGQAQSGELPSTTDAMGTTRARVACVAFGNPRFVPIDGGDVFPAVAFLALADSMTSGRCAA